MGGVARPLYDEVESRKKGLNGRLHGGPSRYLMELPVLLSHLAAQRKLGFSQMRASWMDRQLSHFSQIAETSSRYC